LGWVDGPVRKLDDEMSMRGYCFEIEYKIEKVEGIEENADVLINEDADDTEWKTANISIIQMSLIQTQYLQKRYYNLDDLLY
jgi:hypothetical protein